MISKDHSSAPIPLINFIRSNSSFSRRDTHDAIKNGTVYINNSRVTNATQLVYENDTVKVNNQVIKLSKLLYYKFNKPIGTVSTFNDPNGRRDLTWYLKKHKLPATLKPCGRLDSDSSGLLLFSNDGQFINHVLHPKHTIIKTYRIQLDSPLTEADKTIISNGFFLPDGPVSITFKQSLSNYEHDVSIGIGRNRILRRSFEQFGYTIVALHRLSIGPISIANLSSGEFEIINQDLIKILVHE